MSKGLWWRIYEDVLNDPKLQLLPPAIFKGWVNVICLASMNNGRLPSQQEIGFRLRLSPEETAELERCLVTAGLLDRTRDGSLEPHNWHVLQPRSDHSGYERIKRHRERKRRKNEGGTPPDNEGVKQGDNVIDNVIDNADDNAVITPQTILDKTRQDKDESEGAHARGAATPTEPKKKEVAKTVKAKKPRAAETTVATRLPEKWNPSSEDADKVMEYLQPDRVSRELEKFRNYYASAPGVRGLKLDWGRTWRNWAIKASEEVVTGSRSDRPNASAVAGVFVDKLTRQREAAGSPEYIPTHRRSA